MLRQFSPQRIIAFFFLDWLGTIGSFYLATVVRASIGRLPQGFTDFLRSLNIETQEFWTNISPGELITPQTLLLVMIVWPFFLVLFSVYDGRRNSSLMGEMLSVFMAICTATLTLAGLLYFSYRGTPRILVLIFFALDTVLLLSYRLGWGLWRYTTSKKAGVSRRAVIVVGAGPVGQNVIQHLRRYATRDIDLVGFLDDDPNKQNQKIDEMPVLGYLDDVEAIVSRYSINDAVVALPLRAHERMVEICRQLQACSVQVHVIPDLFALSFPNAELDGFGGIPVIHLGRPGIQGWQRVLKRGFDLIAVSIGLLLLSPFLLLIAALIMLDSRGPILYRQTRIGEFGRPFTMYKFRSMHVDSSIEIHKSYVTRLIQENLTLEQVHDNGDGNRNGSLKLGSDPRITPVGRFIRKTSLDELPQLINVLRGEMSLVGPRPPLEYEVELYQDWHRRRFNVPPGMTGLWQVKGRNRVSFDEMVRMDLEYIEHQSLLLDIKLLLQTPGAVLSAIGAG